MDTIIVRKTICASKGPEVTFRKFGANKNSDILRNPCKTEIKFANVRLRPNSVRESQLVERGITTRTTNWVRRPWRKFMKQAIASCIRQILSNSLQRLTWDSKKYNRECTRSHTIGNDTSRWTRTQIQNSTQSHHQESREEQASGNREALTHTCDNWWKANWWIKSWWEGSKGPRRKSEGVLPRWSWSDEFFSSSKVSHSRWSSYFVCDCRCTHTHMLLAHFLRTARSLRTSHIFMRVTHAWLKVMKKMFVACACRLSLDFSHVSPVSVCCFCTVTSRPTSPTHPSTRSGRTSPAQKRGSSALRTRTSSFGYLATSVLITGYEPNEFEKITSVDVDTPPINDPDHNISDFSKTTSENTGHSVLNPLFCTFLIGDFALQRESKESTPRETVARQRKRGKRRFCDQRCRVGVKEKSTEQYQESFSSNSKLMNEISENTSKGELKKLSWWKFSSEKIVLDWVRHGDPKFGAKKFRIRIIRVATRAWISKTTVIGRYSMNKSSSAWENTFV